LSPPPSSCLVEYVLHKVKPKIVESKKKSANQDAERSDRVIESEIRGMKDPRWYAR
jgi:hypothetical protein